MNNHNSASLTDRLEFVITQIGAEFAATGQPMHVALQGVIDKALDEWSTDPADREQLASLVATRITVPEKTDYVPVINLDHHTEPLEQTDWPQSW